MLDQIKDLQGYTHNLKVRYLEFGIETYPDMAANFYGALVRMTSESYEFRTRILAMQALQRLNFLNEDLAHNLFEATESFNGRLAGPATDVIQYFNKQTNHQRTFNNAVQSYKGNKGKILRILK